ncbi:hypothetical protein [Microbacterium hominis]|uniref:Uncharacterized protein n=1 Tax=Microbacterium hominis TaxID=162426 RepID=A0A7D4TEJ2_9MICO|nr:hypothetical protein [Microbacterium hominis]QKJ17981.1 hypothetical protein HQM25_00140 [Microbacterium hominis]
MGDETNATAQNDPDGEPKPGGLGPDGTIPAAPDGPAAGHTGEPSTFEPEEDPGSGVADETGGSDTRGTGAVEPDPGVSDPDEPDPDLHIGDRS